MLRPSDAMRLIMVLHGASAESDTTQKLATTVACIAIARANGKGLGKAVDAELRKLLEELTKE